MEVRAALVILLVSSLVPPAPADGFALAGWPGSSAGQRYFPSRGFGTDTPHGGGEAGRGWAGNVNVSSRTSHRNTTRRETRGSRIRGSRSTWAGSAGGTLAVRAAKGARCGQRLREGVRRGCDSSGAAGVARMGLSGGGDEVGHLEIPGQEEGREKAAHRVIFMRHGESEWNSTIVRVCRHSVAPRARRRCWKKTILSGQPPRDNRFLGWADIDLTEEGQREAEKAARVLMDSGTHVDVVFCSYLKRSIKSAWILAAEMDQAWMPIHCDWRLNEQMYGALTGLNKRKTAERYGAELTQRWRRSYETAPPAVPGGRGYFPEGDAKYAALTQDDIPDSWCGSPNTESLKDAQARAWMLWRERVVPSMRQGKTALICAHGNIIRAMLKRLDCIPNDALKELSIPRAVPLVYDLDQDFEPIRSSSSSSHVSVGPLRGHFLGDAEELRAALEREGMQLGPVGGDGDDHGGVGVGLAAPEAAVPPSTVGPAEDHPFVV